MCYINVLWLWLWLLHGKSVQTHQIYVAIELESLQVALAMETYHLFLYGRKCTLETDQKPIENVLVKSLTQAAPRFQCLFIRALPYDFNVMYTEGSTNQLVDCLSRLGPLQKKIQLTIVQVHKIPCRLQATATRIQLLHEAIAQICVHSNTWCKLVGQARYKRHHFKFNHIGISMKTSLCKMVSYSKG